MDVASYVFVLLFMTAAAVSLIGLLISALSAFEATERTENKLDALIEKLDAKEKSEENPRR